MNRNRPMVAFSFLACAFMSPLFQHGAHAQSARISAYSEDVPADASNRESVSQTSSAVAPNMEPTDLLGDIWKRSDHSGVATAGKGDYIPSTSADSHMAFPVAEHTTSK